MTADRATVPAVPPKQAPQPPSALAHLVRAVDAYTGSVPAVGADLPAPSPHPSPSTDPNLEQPATPRKRGKRK